MLPKILTTQLTLNWITRILFFVSLSALLPVMPNYINDIGGNNSQIGIVMSAFAVGVLVFRPMVGKQIDIAGRKIVLLVGSLIFIISPIIYMFVPSVALLIPVRVFHGLGLAAFGTASITLITDSAPAESRGQVISYTGMINTIGFAVGPALGFQVWEVWGYDVLFGMTSGLALLCLLISLVLKETKNELHARSSESYWQVIKQRRIMVAASIILLVALVHGGVVFYMPIFLKELNVNIGLFFTVYGIAAFLIRVVVGPASDKLGRGPVMVLSLVFLTAGVLTLSQATGNILMLTSAVLYGIGFGSHQPTLTALVADNTTEKTRGQIFSFYYGGFDLGISVAGFVLGAMADSYGIKNMFLVCVGLASAAWLVFVTLMESSLRLSLNCAFSLKSSKRHCDICDQYQEVSPKVAEAYFEAENKNTDKAGTEAKIS